jgi:uncharacterized protein YneF (UPF0154 family)
MGYSMKPIQKRLKIFTMIFIFLFMFSYASAGIFAGDIPVDLTRGENQAIFIGEILETDSETTLVKSKRILMGKITYGTMKLQPFKYYGTDEVPKKGDFIVAVLIEEGKIKEDWLFKASSSDYTTLEISGNHMQMVKQYQDMINLGAYQKAHNTIYNNDESVKEDKVNKFREFYIRKSLNQKYKGIEIGYILLFFIYLPLFILALYIGKKLKEKYIKNNAPIVRLYSPPIQFMYIYIFSIGFIRVITVFDNLFQFIFSNIAIILSLAFLVVAKRGLYLCKKTAKSQKKYIDSFYIKEHPRNPKYLILLYFKNNKRKTGGIRINKKDSDLVTKILLDNEIKEIPQGTFEKLPSIGS